MEPYKGFIPYRKLPQLTIYKWGGGKKYDRDINDFLLLVILTEDILLILIAPKLCTNYEERICI